jgi:tetratricopeptide (TPR) repeat protein
MDQAEQVSELATAADKILAAVRAFADALPAEGEHATGPELDRARGLAEAIIGRLHEADGLARSLWTMADAALVTWRTKNRFTPEGLAATVASIGETARDHPDRARIALLSELAAAVRALAIEHAIGLLRACASWQPVPPGLLEDLAAWNDGDDMRGRSAVQTLVRAAAESRRGRVRQSVQKLRLTEAWLSHRAGDSEGAAGILSQLIEEASSDASLWAERAGLRLLMGNREAAADDARRAIELDQGYGESYVQAGAVAEVNGDYGEAAELYEEGSKRLRWPEFVATAKSASFSQRTGLLYVTWAQRLRQDGAVRDALEAAEQAITVGISGTSPYPEAAAYELKWRLLRDLGADGVDVAQAAFEAGKRHVWNQAIKQAQAALRVAVDGGAAVPEAGWYLAASLFATEGSQVPEAEEASVAWDEWSARVGPPTAACAWAYGLRANIEQMAAASKEQDSGPAAWKGLMLSEKGLVLDPLDTSSWAVACRCFRVLSMTQLALEAIEAGYTVNPDHQWILEERVAVLADVGRTREALDALERLPNVRDDPWLSGIKAFLLQRLGQPAEALDYLVLPLSGWWDLGWYRDLRARCYVDLGRLDEAVEDLTTLLTDKSPLSGQARSRRVYALAILGDVVAAKEELQLALDDDTLDREGKASARFDVALAEGDTDRALTCLAVVLGSNLYASSVKELLRSAERTLALLNHVGRPVADAAGLMERMREMTRAWKPGTRDADSELDAAWEAHAGASPESVPWVALSAVQARRLATDKRTDEAARLYGGLVGTAFEPEATLALGQTLEQQYRQVIEAGNVERTREIYDRLAGIGQAPTPFADVAVAEALRAKGDNAGAVTILSALLPSVAAPPERLPVLEMLGECALFDGQASLAESAFSEAFDLAVSAENRSHAAQIAVRQAAALTMRGQLESAFRHLARALSEWVEAGTWDPQTTLRLEIGWLIDALSDKLGGPWPAMLKEALEEATAVRTEDAGEP